MPPVGEPDDEDFEFEDDDLDNEDLDDGNENTEDELGSLDPALQKAISKLLDEREAAISKEIAEGKTKHPVYKEIQRSLNKEQARARTLEQQLTSAIAKLEQFGGSVEEITEGLNWASGHLLDALPEDNKNAALNDLNARRVKRTETELARLRNGGSNSGSRPQRDDDDIPARIREGLKQFKEQCDELATEYDVEADDPRLDFGDEDEALVVRLKKFRASLKEVVNEDGLERRVASVRKKTEPVTTRTGGGAAVSSGSHQRKSLEDISREISREIRRTSGRR